VEWSAHVVAGPEAARNARASLGPVAEVLEPSCFEVVQLLVSELVSNAVRHADLSADEQITLRVGIAAGFVRVEVHDPGRGFALQKRTSASPQGSGWGLFLVERLADQWGVHTDGGTTVWFEIDRTQFTSRNGGQARTHVRRG